MRVFAMIALLALAACTEATATAIDNRTFRVDGPGIPGGSDAPNRRTAARLCPSGYRVLDSVDRRNTPDNFSDQTGSTFTIWTIRCI
ncbi:MAG TPA: hypothetical protein VGS13_13535 [Stellaceae bacterium]|nr:hypothetical protein [Stellaceae bacterium]